MDHVNAVLESDPNDIVLGEICADRGQSLSNLICFVCLYV